MSHGAAGVSSYKKFFPVTLFADVGGRWCYENHVGNGTCFHAAFISKVIKHAAQDIRSSNSVGVWLSHYC